MKVTIIRKTVKEGKETKILYSIGTDFCIWSGMDGFGRYLWRSFDLPDEDGIQIFDLRQPIIEDKKFKGMKW